MSRRRALIGMALAAALTAPTASAQSVTLFPAGGPGHPVSITAIPGQLTGTLTVAFHGDPATGCATQGLCAYSGTVVLSPGSSVAIGVERFRHNGRTTYQAEFGLGGGPAGTLTAAHVQRVGGGLCGDATSPFVSLPVTITRGIVTAPLLAPGGTLLSTRCAGPLDGDVSSVSPQIRLPLSQLLRGRRTLDLSGTRSFAGGGFAGTFTSTLRLSLGRPTTQAATSRLPRGIRSQPDREVTETLSVTHASGQLGLSMQGESGSCEFLDACGLHGSTSGTVAPQAPTASLTVLGPASRPYADFLAALGQSRQGNPRGLAVIGAVGWQSGGTAASNLSQGIACTSQAPLGSGEVTISGRNERLVGSYGLPASPRTRCPGPMLAQNQSLATGSVSLRGVGARGFTLHLSGQGPLSDDGYAIFQRTTLTLTLRRVAIRRLTLRVPAP